MKVLGIGESVIDNAQIIGSDYVEKHVGGPSLIALMILARLGIDCTLLTTLGRDTDAKIIKKTLKHDGIKVAARIERRTKVNNYLINPENGARQKIRGDVIHPDIKHLDRNFIRKFDIIIIDRHERSAFYEILEKKKPSAKIVIDPSTEVSPFTMDMIKHADYPIIPIEALVEIGNAKNLSLCLGALQQITKKPVVITAGEFGSIIYDGKTVELIPSLQVKAVDVQGAGDIYRGAFTYGIIQGWDYSKSAEYANKIAALHCTKLGNAAAVPKKEEIAVLDKFIVQKTQISVPKIHEHFFTMEKTI